MWYIQNTYQVLADKHSYQSSKGLNFHFYSQATLKLVIFPYSEQAERPWSLVAGDLRSRADGADWFVSARVLSTGNSETQAPAV